MHIYHVAFNTCLEAGVLKFLPHSECLPAMPELEKNVKGGGVVR